MELNPMQTLVINLKRSAERMRFQETQLQALGIEFQRIDAIDAKEMPSEIYTKNASQWQRPLRKSEVACCLSHAAAWEAVLKKQEPCLILEDDALLCAQTGDVLSALEKYTDYDCVNLETRKRSKLVSKKKIPLIAGFEISKLIQDKSGSAAYVLWPSGAAILLNWLRTHGAGLADALLSTGPSWKHGQIEPAIAVQMDCCDHYGIESPIQTQTSIHHSPKPKAQNSYPFYWRRFRAQFLVAQRKLRFCFSAENKEIQTWNINTGLNGF
jgi:glycosyl transferase family 25